MILIDFNQVIIAALFVSIGNHHNAEINEDVIRHMFLNTLRSNRKKFKSDYGEIVICADGSRSWRKDVFPYYKANRKKNRDESELDWSLLHKIMEKIRNELDEFFPYKVLHFDHLEADDIIGSIVRRHGAFLGDGNEKILIFSSDKDFIQLHRYSNVSQYDMVRKKWISNNDPEKYLVEHIIRGDSGDGIPNILSEDNCLVVGNRQKPITAKRLLYYSDKNNDFTDVEKMRLDRNKTLIDLTMLPEKYYEEVIEKFEQQKTNGRKQLFNYFVEHRLKNLLPDIGDF